MNLRNLLPSVLEEEKCVKQYYIWKIFPLLINVILTNIQAKIQQKLPEMPALPIPSKIKVIVGG